MFESGITVVLVKKITLVTHYNPRCFHSEQEAIGWKTKKIYQKKSIMMKIVRT